MNTKTKILSFLLAVVMILSVVPALTVSAEEPVDLIHESDEKTVKDGVFFTYEGGIYGSDTPEKAINGNDDHGWRSAFRPSATPWFQLNFPLASQWTYVRLKMAGGDYKCAIEIQGSNDPSFEPGTYDVIEETSEFSTYVTIDDASKFTKPYRYFRIVTKGARLGIMEIDITGYEPVAPSIDGLVDLAQKADVYAKVATEDAATYTAQQVLDGDASTGYTVTGGTNPELMVDLRRESAIGMVEFTPASGNDAYRKNYEIHTSNSPTFDKYTIFHKNSGTATAEGVPVKVYIPENTSARYVRIKASGADLGVAELKVWGTDGTFTLENMTSPAYVTSTSGENAEYTVDNDVATVYKSEEEATKSALIYDLDGAMSAQSKTVLPVTSIMLLPADDEECRKNFNIYGSVSGDFEEDADLIKAVGSTPLAIGQYEIISLDDPKAYKKIKIEKAEAPSAAESLAFREVKIIHNSQETVVKIESISADGATGITNFGDGKLTNLIEVELNRKLVASSINPTNVVIKDVTDGADTVLTDWEAYGEITGKKFSIDVANLSSNKTYEVTLTTNIETTVGNLPEEYTFTFTTGNIVAIPYDPDKVLVNVAIGKGITGKRNASFGALTNAIDGNDSSYTVSSGAPQFQIDLGNFYDIVAFELVPASGDNKTLLQNLNVLGSGSSIDYEKATADELTSMVLTKYPGDSTKKETLILENSANVRYLGLYRASTYMVLPEFKAYAYVDKDTVDFGAWKMLKDDVETAEFSAAGTYTFSTAVNNLSDSATSYYMTVFAYDNNGSMVQKANASHEVPSGKKTISSSVTLSEEDFAKATHITAVLYKSFGDAQMVVDAKTVTKKDADLNAPTVIDPKDSVKLDYTAGTDNERVAVQVLGPKSDKKGYDFDKINETAFNSELYYSVGTKALAKDEKATFYFKAPAEAYGEYSIRMTVTKADGTTETYDTYLLYLSDEDISKCVEEFKAFPSTSTMRELIDKWSDNLETGEKYFKKSEIPSALLTSIPEKFDVMFEYLCDIYVDKFAAEEKTMVIEDVVDLINAAYVMAMYEAGDASAVEDALTKYDGDINGLYERKDENGKEIIDVDKYATVYADLKSNVTDAAAEDKAKTLESVMQWAVPLSLIQGGTRDDVENAMENYADVLGYDITYATDKDVTLAQVAMKIDTTNASSYYNTFAEVFEDAVDAVIADPEITTTPESSTPPIITGGVGDHGSRPAETTKPEDKPVTPVDPVTPIEPDAQKAPFNDINNIDWAKDHINTLYNEGIISGDGDGAFHPNRHVTREEFVKMLVEALKIDVASKEASKFDDCDPGAWYYPYVQIASSNKITKGIDRKNFGIGQNITRQDMAVLLSKALSIKSITAVASDYVFDDENDIADYAKTDVSKMYSLGLISGMGNGTFAPKDYTTRAQAAVIIGRALEILGGASK